MTAILHTLNNAFASLFWFVVVVGILVFLHESGHFLTAKFFGIKVDVFSLGFGRRLWGRKRGETDYRVSLIPLGGYVKLAGGEEAGEAVDPIPPDYFLARPRWQRFLVLVMGPAVNLVLAVVVFTGAFVVGHEMPAKIAPVIKAVRPDTPAAVAGLKPGDRVVRVSGEEVTGWNEVDVRLVRAGLQDSGIGWNAPPIVGPLTPGMPAERAGLKTGDRIEAVDGQPVTDAEQVVDTIHGSLGRELTLTVRRGDEVLTFAVTPVKGVSATGKEVGLTGFMFQPPIELVKLPPVAAFRRGLALAREQAGVLFGVLRHLIIRDGKLVTMDVLRDGQPLAVTLKPNVGFSSLSGPLDIAQASRTYASDLPSLLLWMGFISLQLGILNLLPIPVLDGGHILFVVTEGILRRDLSMQVKERLNQVGFIALVTLMAAVVCQDIWKRI